MKCVMVVYFPTRNILVEKIDESNNKMLTKTGSLVSMGAAFVSTLEALDADSKLPLPSLVAYQSKRFLITLQQLLSIFLNTGER